MNQKSFLSIITINYNNINGLQKTFESVLNQTFDKFEWIIIDGGSTDGSRDFIETKQDYLAYCVSEKDKGIYNALNKGLKYASGEYVQFLNSGDWLYDENVLQKVTSAIKNDNASNDIYYGDMIQVNDGGKQNPISYPDELGFFFFPYNNICHQATFYRRSLFDNNPYDESYTIVSDWAMNLKLLFQGCTFKHLSQYIVYYDNKGKSSEANNKHHEERISAFDKYVPQQVQVDLKQYETKYYFSRHRRSTHFMMDLAIDVIRWLDNILSVFERKR